MTYALATINPAYAARFRRFAPSTHPELSQPVYARLPLAPKNASPVPHLTSLYHFHRCGEYGDRSYPGNCGGNLIKDLLRYFQPQGMVFDPMSGSGTCRDVCRELGIPCLAWDSPSGLLHSLNDLLPSAYLLNPLSSTAPIINHSCPNAPRHHRSAALSPRVEPRPPYLADGGLPGRELWDEDARNQLELFGSEQRKNS